MAALTETSLLHKGGHGSPDRVRLLTADPELAEAVPAEEREMAERLVVADARRLPRGAWEPDLRRAEGPDGFALLVLSGAITREVVLSGRTSAELVGPGDVLRPSDGADSLVPYEVRWTVNEASDVAVLDERFTMAARRWPGLGRVITDRLLEQGERLAVHVAIAQLGRVELRVLALLWHLADRWGRVTADGVHLPLRLTHEALGRLVGAQRPTVTLALADLAGAGRVTRSGISGWLLEPGSRDLLSGRPAADAAAEASA